MVRVEFDDVWVRLAADGERARLVEPSESVFEERLRAVVLGEPDGERALAIWMGSADAFALLRHHRGIDDGRPVPAGVMAALLDVTGGRVDRVEITRVRENVCYADIHLEADGCSATVDARPSDALNLAVRVGAPIFVAEQVMSELAFPVAEVPARLGQCQHQGVDVLQPGRWRPLSPNLVRELRDAAD